LISVSLFAILIGLQFSGIKNNFSLIELKITEIVHRIQFYLANVGLSEKRQAWLLSPGSFSLDFGEVAGSFLYSITSVVLIFAYMTLILYYRSHINAFLLKLPSKEQKEETAKVLASCARISQQYLLGLAKMIICLWVMYGIGFSLLNVKNAIFFAVLCGLLEIVPFIGNITGTCLTLLAASANGASTGMLVGVVATYAAVQFIQGWLLEPLIVGPQVKINPLFTLVALVAGELIWGIPGIILAIPVTAILKIIFDHIETLKPYGFLIGTLEKTHTKSSLWGMFRRS
jgi:predicted PurR-regulated permease PerM